jgi:O-antigen chain-terminating methyltransferase
VASDNGDAGVTVEELLDHVRAEVARRRRTLPAATPPSRPLALNPDFQHIEILLGQAQTIADVGAEVPPFARLGAVPRIAARALTRVLYFFLQVITVDQRVFNDLVLRVLRGLNSGLRQGETTLITRLDQLVAPLADLQTRLLRVDADSATRVAELEAEVAALKREIDRQKPFVDALREREPVSEEQLAPLYAAFIDRFRGSREAIVERVRTYLPTIQTAGAGTAERPVLDLACGRGEWLEVLRDAQLHGRGIDRNPLLVEQCRAHGFDVARGEILAYLRSAADASYGAITALHVVEHLTFTALVALLDETVRVLAPGGVAIFESPNAYNLLVGACTFHTDPTHHQPLAPEVLHFLAEARGLTRVEIRSLHRSPGLPALADDAPALLRRLAPHLEASEDYAVIGYRKG